MNLVLKKKDLAKLCERADKKNKEENHKKNRSLVHTANPAPVSSIAYRSEQPVHNNRDTTRIRWIRVDEMFLLGLLMLLLLFVVLWKLIFGNSDNNSFVTSCEITHKRH